MNYKKKSAFIAAVILLYASFMGCRKLSTASANLDIDLNSKATLTEESKNFKLTDKKVTFKAFKMANTEEYDMNKNESWKRLSEKTGIYFEWQNPIGPENAAQAFELLLASQQLPDLVFSSVNFTYPGGLEKAVDNGVYIDLKDKLQEYAPNYWSKISTNKDIMNEITTNKGYIPGIYQIQELYKDKPGLIRGMMLRGDWLEELNLPIPKTIDEWYVTLKAFKEKKKAVFPLLVGATYGVEQAFLSAFGIYAEPFGANALHQYFYPDENGRIRYGGIETGYQEYLKTMSKWYKEGLLDRDFMTRGYYDLTSRAKLVGNNKAGATAIYINWIDMFKSAADDPNFKLVAAPFPSITGGKIVTVPITRPKYTTEPVSITSACKQPELLIKFFDYLCTDEGLIQVNYGISGDTYIVENNMLKLTDKVIKSPLGASVALDIYTGNFRPFSLQYSENLIKQLFSPYNLAQRDVFYDSSRIIYLDYQLTAEEGEKLTRIMDDIVSYTYEQTIKAVLVPAIAENWMEVQARHIKAMKIDEAIAIIQTAYDRQKNIK
ncbi:extracellular solute-binding protein [Clostridium sp. SYSU_GA19001]|uniref:extracellular solute-binding protein n=1 Tax=Clostridium caldaquaticum TaxID=2940653 RepID=UPI0020770363|nr:extracellular solute-binding protein [Clostridium caldaquaticum]MCM8709938.1 extracellular solute-binding protein [Clostridium caldaquaticum]